MTKRKGSAAGELRCIVCRKRLKGKQKRFCSDTCVGTHRQSERGAKAYAMRTAGRPWAEVAEELDYATPVVALGAARRHAKYNNLPWPIKVN